MVGMSMCAAWRAHEFDFYLMAMTRAHEFAFCLRAAVLMGRGSDGSPKKSTSNF